MLTAKEVMQAAVLSAHDGNNTIIETDDFMWGAWQACLVMSELAGLKIDLTTTTGKDIMRQINEEHAANWKSKMSANG